MAVKGFFALAIPSSRIYRDSAGFFREAPAEIAGSGNAPNTTTITDLDTDGNPVPTYKAHAYTYDTSGNLHTDTVTNGTDTWVRTLLWANGVQSGDSGWVKQ